MIYSEVSHDIKVEVEPRFIPERSRPEENFYFYAYHVRISNLGQVRCQLLGRHWIIKDGSGREEHVMGDGVVGEQPVLEPLSFFEYTSFCPLKTPTGNMRGSYEMRGNEENSFKIKIPLFFLRANELLH